MHDFLLMNESIRGFLLRKKKTIEKEIKKRRKKEEVGGKEQTKKILRDSTSNQEYTVDISFLLGS